MEIKKFKLPGFKRPTNPLSNEGMKALAIVLGAIAFIAGAFRLAEFKERQESVVLPAKVGVERTVAPEVIETQTEIPGLKPTPVLEGIPVATVSPAATESALTE